MSFSSQPHTQIHVRNLQTQIPISTDAWGRPSKLQPVLISLSVSLKQHFSSASDLDAIEGSTVHYGTLSKCALQYCANYQSEISSAGGVKSKKVLGLKDFVVTLSTFLFTGDPSLDVKAVLDMNAIESLTTTVHLPKASLLGQGVELSMRMRGMYHDGGAFMRETVVQMFKLSLVKLCVPCFIGVNDIERTAKQLVVATVGFESAEADWHWGKFGEDFVKLEGVVVKAISESEFKTLETLTSHLTTRIIQDFLSKYNFGHEEGLEYPLLRILLEKPTAVTFADAPAVEVLVGTNPKNGGEVAAAWKR